MRLRGLALGAALASLAGCSPRPAQPDPAKMELLRQTYELLHARLEKASATEPLLASAFDEKGRIVLAIRSGLIEVLAGNVAKRYLDRVSVDLHDVEAHGSGELNKKTVLGRIKLGDWSVSLEIGDLVGKLQAGSPRVGLRGPDLIDVELPVEVQESEGGATLHFSWDSKALANIVCKDFQITSEIRGRVLAQQHSLRGALRLANTGESLTATPLFPERSIELKLDLTPQSWAVVEQALRSQDTFGKCGTLMNPELGLLRLRELAAKGIKVRLPDSIFRTVSLPARLQKSVRVNQRSVGLEVKAESLRIETATLWSSASVQVRTSAGP